MSFVTRIEHAEDPREAFAAWQEEGEGILLVSFTLSQYWLPSAPGIELTAMYLKQGAGVACAVTEGDLVVELDSALVQWQAWRQALGFAVVEPGQPLFLQAEYIPKPWGQEIWFTGVEERGLCHFQSGDGSSPIPWLQAVMPGECYGEPAKPLVLLKVLDPSAESVTGDLYFELHEEKREVYVVTHVDPGAWPEGTGYIRFGFDPERVAAAASEGDFRRAYLESVHRYESVRREIDDLDEGAAPGADLQQREEQLRAEMNAFTHMRALRAGDVVKVPLCFPHSLQHGVRTIEFQTPVYERKILSFAQKVLTQDHWDTAEAVERMTLEQEPPEVFEPLGKGDGWREERIVDFPDFEVSRVHLAGGEYPLNASDSYRLVMAVNGQLAVNSLQLQPEQACLVPRGWQGFIGPAEGAAGQVFLCARPRR